jgi:hypothetical protein
VSTRRYLARTLIYLFIYFSGGDYIAFRGGRIDAKQAGPAGVPEPQDTLAQHTADFARQGFTPTEMIQVSSIVA